MHAFDKINRRIHLYLGLLLLPWLLMYGVSSFIIIHQSWLKNDKEPAWEASFEKQLHEPIRVRDDMRATAQDILKSCNLEGAFWANKPNPDTVQIDRFSFWGSTRLTYSIKDQKVKAERQRMGTSQAIVRMHFRGGFGQPTFWDKFWGLLVDCACVGIIVWAASGVMMWWSLPRLRIWGAIVLAGGVLSFVLLIWRL